MPGSGGVFWGRVFDIFATVMGPKRIGGSTSMLDSRAEEWGENSNDFTERVSFVSKMHRKSYPRRLTENGKIATSIAHLVPRTRRYRPKVVRRPPTRDSGFVSRTDNSRTQQLRYISQL